MQPKVSVIVPVYNVEEYLPQCLDGLINQTLQDIEIICVNDGSTDNSLEILQSYAKRDDRILVINQENKGPGIARNVALDIAHGDYIMFCDPDDWYELNACEVAWKQITNNNNDMVIFNYNRFIEKQGKLYTKMDTISPYIQLADTPSIKFSDLDINFLQVAHVWFYIYNRKFLNDNKVRFGELYFCEDVLFAIKATFYAKDISATTVPLYNYRQRASATNQSSKIHLWHDSVASRASAFEFLKTLAYPREAIPQVLYIVRTLCYWFNVFSARVNYRIQKSFYNEMQQLFREINSHYHILEIEDALFDRKIFKKIINKGFYKYQFDEGIKNLIYTKNKTIDNKRYKIVSIAYGKIVFGFQKD